MRRRADARNTPLILAWIAGLIVVLLGPSPLTAYADGDASAAEGKTYEIATDTSFPPHIVPGLGGEDELSGLDIELTEAIAEVQGFKVTWKPLGFDAAIQAVTSGQADGLIAAAGITEERKQVFDFSDPYLETKLSLAVKDGEGEKYQSWDDLKGQTIMAKTGSLSETHARELAEEHGFKVRSLEDSATMYEEVLAGRAVGVMDDYPVLAYGSQTGNGLELVLDPIPVGNLGFAVAKDKNPELLAAFNEGLETIKQNGTYDEISEKWLGEGSAKEKSSFWELLKETLPSLLQALGITMLVTLAAIVFASALGIVFGFAKVSGVKVLRWIADIYVNVFRGTPLLVQAFFFYLGVPAVLGIKADIFWTGILVLSLNAGAYMTEIVRGGIQSVDVGQSEAARSLGLNWTQTMSKVVAPQAIKIATPAAINQFIMTLKDTSILAVLGLAELTYRGRSIISQNLRSFEMWLIVGALYFIVIMLLTMLSNFLDRRFNK